MARLLLNPYSVYYDSDGTVLSNGTITMSATGTATAKASYVFSDEEQEQRNPIEVSASGFTTNSTGVWLDSDAQYRVVIKDEDSNTIKTLDGIEPIMGLDSLTRNLDVNGNDIVSTSNGNITLAPTGLGRIKLDNNYWPSGLGAANQVFATDGSGNLSWQYQAVLNDTTPQLGGNLDTNSFNIKIDTSHGLRDENSNEQFYFTTTGTAVNYLNLTNAATGNGITLSAAGSDTNIDLNLNPKGSSNVVISGLDFPKADSSSGHTLRTDGAGTVSLQPQSDLLQRKIASSATYTEVSNILTVADTAPGATDGEVIVTTSFTPKVSDSALDVTLVIPNITPDAAAGIKPIYWIVVDGSVIVAGLADGTTGNEERQPMPISGRHVHGTTSPITVEARMSTSSGLSDAHINGNASSRLFGGVSQIFLIIDEVIV